ncbi:hypothetical protein Tco_1286146 [Tanacetum coccineum]
MITRNYLATFTPQKQLTPEQIFWSKDLLKMKAEALKEQDQKLQYLSKRLNAFSDMHDAYTAAQKCIAELEAENSNLTHKIQKNDHDEMIKHFSKLEVEHLNLQLKNQHLKESYGNKKLVTSSDAPAFDSVFVNQNPKRTALQGNRAIIIRELKETISRLKKKHSEADPILDFKALDSQNKDLNAKVKALQDLNERFRAENEKVKQHYKELYDSIKITRAKTIDNTTSLLTEIENLKAQTKGKTNCSLCMLKNQRFLLLELLDLWIGLVRDIFNKRDRHDSYAPLIREKKRNSMSTRFGELTVLKQVLVMQLEKIVYQFGLSVEATVKEITLGEKFPLTSVISLKTYERYSYTFLKEIVLRRADYNEYTISEADFKNLQLNDFEDLYLLHLQGQLNNLSGAKKFISSTHIRSPTLITGNLSMRFCLRLNLPFSQGAWVKSSTEGSGGSSKDGDGDTSFQWS